MLTKKQIDSLKPKPFEPVGRYKLVAKHNSDGEIEGYDRKFFPRKTFAPELGKYVDKMKRGYYTTTELKTKFL